MRAACLVVVCGVVVSCSNTYDSALLRLKYEPPAGVKLVEELPGPPAMARFNNGLEIRSVVDELPEADDHALETWLPAALELAGLPALSAPPTSARAGSIPLGPVARYEVKSSGRRSLIYVVPQGERFLLLT